MSPFQELADQIAHSYTPEHMKSDYLVVEVWEVTPEVAAIWLRMNTRNRNLRESGVRRLTDDMRHGRWIMTGETIGFSRDGRLLDGQHRLMAVVRSQQTITMIVVRGLHDDAQRAMDAGIKRTGADMFRLMDQPHAAIMAAAIRIAISAEAGRPDAKLAVSTVQLEDWFSHCPEFAQSAVVASRAARPSETPASLVCYSHWRFAQLDREAADAFWRDAAEGIGLLAGDPVLALVKRLRQADRARERLPHQVLMSMIFRAWNARREGRSLVVMRVRNEHGDLPIPDLR